MVRNFNKKKRGGRRRRQRATTKKEKRDWREEEPNGHLNYSCGEGEKTEEGTREPRRRRKNWMEAMGGGHKSERVSTNAFWIGESERGVRFKNLVLSAKKKKQQHGLSTGSYIGYRGAVYQCGIFSLEAAPKSGGG